MGKTTKLTIEEVRYFIEVESDSGCELLSTEYIKNDKKLSIKCKCGKPFKASYSAFKQRNKRQCNECGIHLRNRNKRLIIEEVKVTIENSGYELITKDYVNNSEKLTIKDSDGYFYFIGYNHFKLYIKRNIKRNGVLERFNQTNPYTIQNIKLWCKLNNKSFELLSTEFKGASKRLKWKCLKESCKEEFEATWNDVHTGNGCSFCRGFQVGLSNCLATLNPELAKEWHLSKNGELTPWKVTLYSNKKVWWKCKECGHEWPSSISNRSGKDENGCPKCSKSKGEKIIQEIFDRYNIINIPQYKFKDCRNKNPLPFDIAIFVDEEKIKLKLLIEYDGEQHFYPVNFGGISNKRAEENFRRTQKHDLIKNNYCLKNNITLLRIPYWEFDNIEEILIDVLVNGNMDNKFFVRSNK